MPSLGENQKITMSPELENNLQSCPKLRHPFALKSRSRQNGCDLEQGSSPWDLPLAAHAAPSIPEGGSGHCHSIHHGHAGLLPTCAQVVFPAQDTVLVPEKIVFLIHIQASQSN